MILLFNRLHSYVVGAFWQVFKKTILLVKKIAKSNYFDVLLSSLSCGTPMDGGRPLFLPILSMPQANSRDQRIGPKDPILDMICPSRVLPNTHLS